MEYAFMALCVIGFVSTVYAYILGCKHGLGMSHNRVPTPIKDVIQAVKKPVEMEQEPIDLILGYDYETALKAVKKEHLEGRG